MNVAEAGWSKCPESRIASRGPRGLWPLHLCHDRDCEDPIRLLEALRGLGRTAQGVRNLQGQKAVQPDLERRVLIEFPVTGVGERQQVARLVGEFARRRDLEPVTGAERERCRIEIILRVLLVQVPQAPRPDAVDEASCPPRDTRRRRPPHGAARLRRTGRAGNRTGRTPTSAR